jgi:hypothetical protein
MSNDERFTESMKLVVGVWIVIALWGIGDSLKKIVIMQEQKQIMESFKRIDKLK